jgi:hypothetical protein
MEVDLLILSFHRGWTITPQEIVVASISRKSGLLNRRVARANLEESDTSLNFTSSSQISRSGVLERSKVHHAFQI